MHFILVWYLNLMILGSCMNAIEVLMSFAYVRVQVL
jgi:hypothetical protein